MIRALMTASVLVLGVNAFASGVQTAPAAPAVPASAATTSTSPAVPGAKVASNGTYAKAKEDCLKENSSLKGKALRHCIKGKEGK